MASLGGIILRLRLRRGGFVSRWAGMARAAHALAVLAHALEVAAQLLDALLVGALEQVRNLGLLLGAVGILRGVHGDEYGEALALLRGEVLTAGEQGNS